MIPNQDPAACYSPVFARFYDVIYHRQRDAVDNEFFLKRIQTTAGRILEIGVGTGRLFMTALEQGADIYGIDISPAMLEVLRQKLPAKQQFRISQQNIIDFRYDEPFDLILAPFRVMMHLLDWNEHLQALKNVYEHLKLSGTFIFDVFVPNLHQLINGLDSVVDFEGEYEPGKKLRRIVSTKPDLINQIIDVHFRLEWEEGSTWKTEECLIPLRFFFRYELEHLMARSPFEKYQICGDYNGGRLSQDSKEFIVIGQKQ